MMLFMIVLMSGYTDTDIETDISSKCQPDEADADHELGSVIIRNCKANFQKTDSSMSRCG